MTDERIDDDGVSDGRGRTVAGTYGLTVRDGQTGTDERWRGDGRADGRAEVGSWTGDGQDVRDDSR